MNQCHLLDQIEIDEIHAPVVAGKTSRDSDVVDMEGFDGCLFIVPITDSVDTGVVSATVKQGDASNGSDAAASVATDSLTSAADDDLNDKFLVIDVLQPRNRYLRLNVATTVANIATGNVIAIRYRARDLPTTQPSDVGDSSKWVRPALA